MKRLSMILMVVLLCAITVPAFAGEDTSRLRAFFQSEAFANLLIGTVALGLAALRLRLNDKQRKIMDMAIGIANGVEKAIPDDTDVPGLGKLDRALRRFRRDWAKVKGKTPKEAVMSAARGAFERWVADRNAGRHL